MMRVRDIMTTEVVSVSPETSLKEAARLMITARVSGLPVVENDTLVGVITEGDFLRREVAKNGRPTLLGVIFGDEESHPESETVAEAMTADPITISAHLRLGEAARIMAKRKVKRLPVVDADGRLEGIISRADIVTAFTKPDEVIEDEIREDICKRLLFMDPDTISITVKEGIVTLAGELENYTEAHLLSELTRRIEGVVRVDSELNYQVDDRQRERIYPIG